MDFLDPAKKLAHTRRLYIGYALMGIAILLTAIILVVLSSGYDVDRKTGKVIQNGLVFVNAGPDRAKIYLNGKANGQTEERITIPEGKYTIELQSEGYRSWKKTLQLQGGSIERLVYPRLFPTKLETASAKNYDAAPAFSTQSPDRRWLLVSQPNQLVSFDVFDTANPEDPVKAITLPAGTLTQPAGVVEKLELVEWANDNRHVLLKHSYGEAFEFIMLDRVEPEKSVNINSLTKQNPTTITLRDKKFDKLHLYDAATKSLSFYDAKTSETKALLSGVINFKSYGEKVILYTTEEQVEPGNVAVRILDNDRNYLVRTFKAGEVYLDMAKFDGDIYFATSSLTEGRTYIYKNPIDQLRAKTAEPNPFVLIRLAGQTRMRFSANTRFLSVQAGAKFVTYDFEDQRKFTFTIPGDFPVTELATWMDGHRLTFAQNGKLQVVDFDGLNQQDLGTISPGVLPAFDRDYERLYTLTPNSSDAAKSILLRTSLKLKLKP